jgi:RimJ/RimL family protein N-acetyltransferase
MRITPLEARFTLPLPIYTAIKVGDGVSRDDDLFALYVGLNKDMVAQLRARSLDENDAALQTTSDRERFGTGSYDDWYRKNRVPFGLVHEATGVLAAVAWFGPKPLGRKPLKRLSKTELSQDERALQADNWVTFTYRSYPPFRGKGLMTDFVGFALKTYGEHMPGVKYWGGIDAGNRASLALAEELGFTISEEASDRTKGWLVVTKT